MNGLVCFTSDCSSRRDLDGTQLWKGRSPPVPLGIGSVIVQIGRLVSVLQGHRDRFDLAFSEILESEQLHGLILLTPFVDVAAPAVRTQLPGPQNKRVGAYHFNPLHDGYLQNQR